MNPIFSPTYTYFFNSSLNFVIISLFIELFYSIQPFYDKYLIVIKIKKWLYSQKILAKEYKGGNESLFLSLSAFV